MSEAPGARPSGPGVSPSTRPAGEGDLPILAALDSWPSRETWLRKIDNGEVVVVLDGAEVVGLARFSVLWTTVPFLGLIVVRENRRGHGLSRVLLEGLCDHLRARGFVALLSSSQTDEPGPQAWHLHVGFQSNGIIENIADEGVGELVYRLLL